MIRYMVIMGIMSFFITLYIILTIGFILISTLLTLIVLHLKQKIIYKKHKKITNRLNSGLIKTVKLLDGSIKIE